MNLCSRWTSLPDVVYRSTRPGNLPAAIWTTAYARAKKEVISTVLAGQDCLCIMPTGGGKSLCFQLPAVARGDLTLVVSPLIALMKDQVEFAGRAWAAGHVHQ